MLKIIFLKLGICWKLEIRYWKFYFFFDSLL